MKRTVLCFCLLVSAMFAFANNAQAADPPQRIVVHTQADLPRHSYMITTPTASELLDGGPVLDALAAQVRADTEATLRDYDITDKKTLRGLYGRLSDLALLRGDAEAVHDYSRRLRDIAEKPASRLMSGIEQEAAAVALSAGGHNARHAAYRQQLSVTIATMPWSTVKSDVRSRKAGDDAATTATRTLGMIQASIDPLVRNGHAIDEGSAAGLLHARLFKLHLQQYVADAAAVYEEALLAHQAEDVDIWPARSVTLQVDPALTPVVVAIWDGGVDTALFADRLYSNSVETVNGRDDDGNGFVDDVHGIGFDEDGQTDARLLPRFDDHYPGREPELRAFVIGQSDAMDDQKTPEAAAFLRRTSSLKPGEVGPLMQASGFYSGYSHGTHIAGIAMEGNPSARLLTVREESSTYRIPPPAVTPEVVAKDAVTTRRIFAYLRAQGARVVNMSWGATVADIAGTLEANGIGANANERQQIAMRAFRIYADTFMEAIRDTPEILFITAAGNSDSDVGFVDDVPAGIDLPNVLAVGAVDHAGDEASFTSYGRLVRIYASGDRVDSVVPGGFHMRGSGTSMAAPQVTNLAAKLLAIDPTLTPPQVIALMIDGATRTVDGQRRLIDPKASVALLRKQFNH